MRHAFTLVKRQKNKRTLQCHMEKGLNNKVDHFTKHYATYHYRI